ncbi:MAG: PRC-barrel domain-containing protein [Planctomycetia bacterium]|nr:PRC-barrel domain-containing protein [Planctomycetia bacterium]
MCKGNQIIGLPVIAVDRGVEVEQVKDLVVDRAHKRVVALLVEKGGWFGAPARVLPLRDVQAFGEDAVMVRSSEAIVEAGKVADIQEALDRHLRLKGTKLISSEGRELGTIRDIDFDPRTGDVKSFEVSRGVLADMISGRSVVSASDDAVVGDDAVVVSADAAAEITQNDAGQSEAETAGAEPKTGSGGLKKALRTAGDFTREGAKEVQKVVVELMDGAQEKADEMCDVAVQAIGELRITRALGRPVDHDIRDSHGSAILREGEVVTMPAVEIARKANVLDELLHAARHKPPPEPAKEPAGGPEKSEGNDARKN